MLNLTQRQWHDYRIHISDRPEHFESMAAIGQLLERASNNYRSNALVLQSRDPAIYATYTINRGTIDFEKAAKTTRQGQARKRRSRKASKG